VAADRDLQHAPTRTAPADPALDEALERQARVGRYVLLGRIGAGGMGVVYAAYDPDLDRRIAIKLVRTRHHGEARLLREAKAMARLHHPNVITVHDVGVHEGQVFIAMDIVEGTTLRGLRVDRLPWTEVLAAYRKAGEGLAAAHRAGIVHRDFKPDNVLVAGDGRIVVTDFGLARFDEAEDEAPASPDDPDVDAGERLTKTGSLVGTPAYMAPEQHRGAAADARSDQFAFCVSLYEALYGEHPFVDRTKSEPIVAEIAEAVLAGRVRAEPARTTVPTWARAAVLRGLATDPAARWPSMEALLAALGADPGRRRRRLALAALGVVALGGILVFAFARDRGAAAPPPCQGFESRLAGVWDPATKEAARAALLATGQPYAAKTWDIVAPELDAYATRWVERAKDVCEATVVRRVQTAETHDLRARCLDHRLRALGALTRELQRADEATVERAATAARSLPDLAVCDEPAQLAEFAPPPSSIVDPATISAIEDRLAAARAARTLGRAFEAQIVADQAMVAATITGSPQLSARARVLSAMTWSELGRKDAHERLRAAALEADRARRDEDRVEVLIALLDSFLDNHDYDNARSTMAQARAALDRIGATRPRLEYSLAASAGQLAYETNELETAIAQRRKSIEWAEQITPRDDGAIGGARVMLGYILGYTGDPSLFADSARELATGRQLIERALGADHPKLAQVITLEGATAYNRGDYAAAQVAFARAAEIQRRLLGPQHPSLYPTLYNLARAEANLDRWDAVLEHVEQAIKIVDARPEGAEILRARLLTIAAAAQVELGRGDEGIATAERALSLAVAANGSVDDIGGNKFQLAKALWTLGRDRERAKKLVAEVVRDYRAAGAAMAGPLRDIETWRDEHMK
jgi:tetratricopeptide (TPR) repeat protein